MNCCVLISYKCIGLKEKQYHIATNFVVDARLKQTVDGDVKRHMLVSKMLGFELRLPSLNSLSP